MQTRSMIFNSALELFSGRGFDSVTIDDICAHAGVSRGTFYNHFKSKEQVTVEQLLKVDELDEELLERLRSPQTSCLDRLIAVANYSIKHAESTGFDMIKVAYHSQLGPGVKDKSVHARAGVERERIEDLVRDAQQAGELRSDYSAKRIARSLMSSLHGVIFEWCLQNGEFDLQQAALDAIELTLSGMRADRVPMSISAVSEAG